MKKVLKILLILFAFFLAVGVGFILTLQLFEYRPKELTDLEIENNLADEEANYVRLNDTITILSFNTGYASLSQTEDFVMDGGTKARMDSKADVEMNIEGIEATLQAAEADIYLLQEVDVDSSRSYHTSQYSDYQDFLSLPSSLGYNYRCIFVPFPFEFGQMMGSVNSGIATFTNYYVESAIRHQLPGSFPWPIRLANLKRCVVVSRLPIAGSEKEFVVINVHLSAYDDGSMRLQETEALKAILETEAEKGNYILVGGDFNQTFPQAVTISENPDSTTTYDYLYPLKEPDYWQAFPLNGDWFTENGFQFGVDVTTPTCRLLNQPYDTTNLDNNQYYVIDGYIVSPNIEIKSVTTLPDNFMYSDHNPVQIEIKLHP